MAIFTLHKTLPSINTRTNNRGNHYTYAAQPVPASTRTAVMVDTRTARASTLRVKAEPSERGHEIAQVPETSRTAPTHQDKREDLPEHLVADVSNVTGSESGAQQEASADRYGSHAAASEKAPGSGSSKESDEPLAGEGDSAAD